MHNYRPCLYFSLSPSSFLSPCIHSHLSLQFSHPVITSFFPPPPFLSENLQPDKWGERRELFLFKVQSALCVDSVALLLWEDLRLSLCILSKGRKRLSNVGQRHTFSSIRCHFRTDTPCLITETYYTRLLWYKTISSVAVSTLKLLNPALRFSFGELICICICCGDVTVSSRHANVNCLGFEESILFAQPQETAAASSNWQ